MKKEIQIKISYTPGSVFQDKFIKDLVGIMLSTLRKFWEDRHQKNKIEIGIKGL